MSNEIKTTHLDLRPQFLSAQDQLYYDIHKLYSPLDIALEEIAKRRHDSVLLKNIEQELAFTPELLPLFNKTHLVIFRHVATPSNEFIRVIHSAKKVNVPVFIIEYQEDKFTPSINVDKYALGKLPIYNGADINNADIIHKLNIVDFARMEGHPFSEVLTHKNEHLIELHHWLLREVTGLDTQTACADGSSWLMSFKGPKEYYKKLFKLFIAHNILAEVYYSTGVEESFSRDVIIPSIHEVEHATGYKPLIWNYLNGIENEHEFWECYPKHVGDLLKEKGYN